MDICGFSLDWLWLYFLSIICLLLIIIRVVFSWLGLRRAGTSICIRHFCKWNVSPAFSSIPSMCLSANPWIPIPISHLPPHYASPFCPLVLLLLTPPPLQQMFLFLKGLWGFQQSVQQKQQQQFYLLLLLLSCLPSSIYILAFLLPTLLFSRLFHSFLAVRVKCIGAIPDKDKNLLGEGREEGWKEQCGIPPYQ